MGVPSPTGALAVVSGDARPLRYQTAGTLRQALRWTREDLQSGTARVAIKGDDLTPLLAALADVGRRFADAATVELSRYEVGFSREHIGLVAELEARAPPHCAGGRLARGGRVTRAQLAHVMRSRAEAIAGEPCTLGCVTPDLWTFRSASGCTVHVWREGDAVLLPPWLRRPAPHAPRARTTPGAS